MKNKDEVEPGYPMGWGECKWKGEIICDGQTVEVRFRHFSCTSFTIQNVISGPLQLVVQHSLQKQEDAGCGQVLGGGCQGQKRGLIGR